MSLQWRNQIWQSLEEGAGKRCSECGSNLAPKHEHETHPPLVRKKEFRLDSNDRGFISLVQTLLAAINDRPCFIRVVCNKLTTV